MILAVELVKKGCKVRRAADIHRVDRHALGRIRSGDQELYSTSGAELAIHHQLESDLHDFIVFIFKAGHGIDWVKICEYAKTLAMKMDINGFQASPGWIQGFKARHPDLVRRRTQAMERVRAGPITIQPNPNPNPNLNPI